MGVQNNIHVLKRITSYLNNPLIIFFIIFASGCGESENSNSARSPLPSTPNAEAARAELEGIDTNQDGIRDEVQIMVRGLALSTEEERASLQLARGIQSAILVGARADASNDEITTAGEKLTRAADCVYHRFQARASQQIIVMDLLMADTPERVQAYHNFEARTVGQSFEGATSLEEACDSDI